MPILNGVEFLFDVITRLPDRADYMWQITGLPADWEVPT